MDYLNGAGYAGKHPSLTDIQRDLKAARDAALLGNYMESDKQYSSIIDIVAGILKAPIADERSKRKWEQVLKQIRDEVEPVRAIKSEWESMGEFGGGVVGEAAANGEPERCDLLDDFYTASMAKESPAQRALCRPDDEVGRPGQAPIWDGVFAPPSPRAREEPDSRPRQPRQRMESDQLPGWAQGREPPAVNVRPKARVPSRPERDLGGPPVRNAGGGGGGGGGGASGPARQRNSGVGTAPSGPASRHKEEDNANYARPWRDNARSKDDNSKGGKGGGGSKDGKDDKNHAEAGSYLHSLYGSAGKGPDTDLIEMLERDCVERCPSVSWESIAGLEEAKKLLEEAVVLPLVMPGYFTGIRRAWKGVLLFGPPGTGKTMLAKAVATQCETTFFNVSAASMASKYRGDAEKLVRILFEMARFYAPTTIFFDEVDALGGKRGGDEHEASRRVKAELLVQMDGVGSSEGEEGGEKKKQVTVLAATNRPWDLDEALRRRLEKRVYIPLPKFEGRKQLFEINLSKCKLGPDASIADLVNKTEGYSGADVTNVCREASMMGLRKRVAQLRSEGTRIADVASELQNEVDVPITQADFHEAIKNTSKSVGTEDLQKFSDWMKEFGAT